MPGTAFIGKIVVNKKGKFFGWCNQYYTEGNGNCKNGRIRKYSEVRYLVGALAKEGRGYSVACVKLSNADWQSALFYETHDLSLADSVWSIKDPGGGFIPQGNAEIQLKKLPHSKKEIAKIRRRFKEMNVSTNNNQTWIKMVKAWHKRTLVLWI